jgi:hypothetical protein
MSIDLKQISPAVAFPSGDSRPIAVLADEPSALTSRFGLCFAEGLDDLDQFRYAIIDLGDNRKAVLYKHHGDPNPGTIVRIDSHADPASAHREIATKFSLSAADVLWWSPDA